MLRRGLAGGCWLASLLLLLLLLCWGGSQGSACVLCLSTATRLVPPPVLPALLPRLSFAAASPIDDPGLRLRAEAEAQDVEDFLREKGFVVGPPPPDPEPDPDASSSDPSPRLKEFMLAAIEWYRSSLSPLMPKNCRFLPTCSQYGLDAIKRHGSLGGGVLTAWRILRCNPFGGSGYDPVPSAAFPLPPYNAGSNSNKPKS